MIICDCERFSKDRKDMEIHSCCWERCEYLISISVANRGTVAVAVKLAQSSESKEIPTIPINCTSSKTANLAAIDKHIK